MKTDKIREKFLRFFKKKGHSIVNSDSLVPQNDPSLLFTGAGMNQFKEYFLGHKKEIKRAVSSQKCLRTGDLDEVGETPFHHSFFEMLGNFSFGDYFKKDAIFWAWEFLTKELKIPKEKLHITVHKDDKEAYEIWINDIGIDKNAISVLGDKTNFWPSNAPLFGPNGPCGPCSEIYYDLGGKGTVDDDSGRYAEIWNLVFTQFDRVDKNKLIPLANKNIDTGMGLERLACILQDKKSNFEIDIFTRINERINGMLCSIYKIKDPTWDIQKIYPISDHLRAVVFAIADGALPSNEGRGYVIRKLIRRAVWHAYQLDASKKLKDPFLYNCVGEIINVMKETYPDLDNAKSSIKMTLRQEEIRFLNTLESGLNVLENLITSIKKSGSDTLSGNDVFKLYDTYGFPDELTKAIATDRGIKIDQKGFDNLMKKQKMRSKESSRISSSIFSNSGLDKIPRDIPATVFKGYDTLSTGSKILWTKIQDKKGLIILDITPFYAEGGGQIGDKGTLTKKGVTVNVMDTKKLDKFFVHHVEMTSGKIKEGDKVLSAVNSDSRKAVMRNHTATHLLHTALRKTLGDQVRQLGSFVSNDRLRFDYSYGASLTKEDISKVENCVNQQILSNKVIKKEEKSMADAKKDGATAFFAEKYGDSVRVVTIPEFSKELCAGTHCLATGEIGAFIITSESSVASGVRRIEAITGFSALKYIKETQNQLLEISSLLKVPTKDILARIEKLQETTKKQEKGKTSKVDFESILSKARRFSTYTVLVFSSPDLSVGDIRHISDQIKKDRPKTIYLLGARDDNKIHILLGMSSDLNKSSLDMRQLFGRLSAPLDMCGGGRRDLIQAGCQNKDQLNKNKEEIYKIIDSYLSSEKGI